MVGGTEGVGTVVGGPVGGGPVGGGPVVGGVTVVVGGREGTVVVGKGSSGTWVKMTPGSVKVTAGARDVVVATPVDGGVAVPVDGGGEAGAVLVVVLGSANWVAVPPAARRSTDVGVEVKMLPPVRWGRATLARLLGRPPSREVAATIRITTTSPTPANNNVFIRAGVLRAYHHVRSRSRAPGRPNAAFLPMAGTKR